MNARNPSRTESIIIFWSAVVLIVITFIMIIASVWKIFNYPSEKISDIKKDISSTEIKTSEPVLSKISTTKETNITPVIAETTSIKEPVITDIRPTIQKNISSEIPVSKEVRDYLETVRGSE